MLTLEGGGFEIWVMHVGFLMPKVTQLIHAACSGNKPLWFSSLLEAQPGWHAADRVSSTEAQHNLKRQLYQSCRRLPQNDVAVLNKPLTADEVASAMRLAPDRAADLQGLTGEAVWVAAEKPEGEEELCADPLWSVCSGCYSCHTSRCQRHNRAFPSAVK